MAKNKLVIFALIVMILILVVIIGLQSIPTGMIAARSFTELILPFNAQKLSECVPNMGEHWANLADLPFGPVYLVDKGEVIGIEFMIHEEEMEENILTIAGEKVGKPVVMPTLDVKYDHVELNYMPKGHEGDVEPHYDVHMYLVSPEEQLQLC